MGDRAGGRIKPAEINARFVASRDALGLPTELTPHSLRHTGFHCRSVKKRLVTASAQNGHGAHDLRQGQQSGYRNTCATLISRLNRDQKV
ncbi:MAG: hypothetical protein ACRD0G_00540 [Acidimicrobiales bacterium]